MEAKNITLKTLAISIAAVFALETVFRLTIHIHMGSHLLALGIIRSVQTLCLLIIFSCLEKNTSTLGLFHANILPGFKRGLLWSGWFGIIAAALFLGLVAAGINPLKLVYTPMPSSASQVFIFFLVGGIIGPVAEELFFRGIIFGFFRQWGFFTAVLIATIVFVLPHYDGHHLPLTQIVGGIVFAAAYEKEKNLMVPITIHCLGNMTIFSLTFFS
jgi:membrane protease YdiL (CAAX protease family)